MHTIYKFILFFLFLCIGAHALDYEMSCEISEGPILLKSQKTIKTISTDDLDTLTEKLLCSSCILVNVKEEKELSYYELIISFLGIFKKLRSYAGTAFFISADGHLLTNKHVIEAPSSENIVVYLANSTHPLKVFLVEEHPTKDLAILKVENPEGKSYPYLKLSSTRSAIGDWCISNRGMPFIWFFEEMYHPFFFPGIGKVISSVDDSEELIWISLGVIGGNSGSPVLNLEGEVVSIMTIGISISENVIPIPITQYQMCGALELYDEKEWIERVLHSDNYFEGFSK